MLCIGYTARNRYVADQNLITRELSVHNLRVRGFPHIDRIRVLRIQCLCLRKTPVGCLDRLRELYAIIAVLDAELPNEL